MLETNKIDMHQRLLEEAEKLFDDDRIEECLAQAHKNLADPTIPPYYVIRNYLLIACAVDNWDEGKRWLDKAEFAYLDALWDARQKFDGHALQILAPLRHDIDQANEYRLEDISGMTMEERNKVGWDEYDYGPEYESLPMMDYDDESSTTDLEDLDAITAPEKKIHTTPTTTAQRADLDAACALSETKKQPALTTEQMHIPIRTKAVGPYKPAINPALDVLHAQGLTPSLR